MKDEVKLTAEVEKLLRNSKWQFKRDLVIGDARPDFVVTTDKGEQFVIEVKAWKSSPENVERALHQAQRYVELSKAAGALIVTPSGTSTSSGQTGVVSADKFLSELSSMASASEESKRKSKTVETSKPPKRTIFASMPFAAEYDDTFLVAIEPAALANNAVAGRVDHNGAPGNVVSQIKDMIKSAKLVIADLSGSSPNVLHEVGFAEALKKPIIQITRTPPNSLPFNVRNNQTLSYSVGQCTRLKGRLEAEIKKNLS